MVYCKASEIVTLELKKVHVRDLEAIPETNCEILPRYVIYMSKIFHIAPLYGLRTLKEKRTGS